MNRILLALLIVIPLFSVSQTFEKSIVAANGERIGFLEFRPPDYSGPKHPLIIFLHGIGEKGNGTTQLKNVKCCGIPSYIRGGNKMQFTWQGKTESFVVLSPQLSKKYSRWQLFYTDELIKYAKEKLNIDPDRIFVTGLSLGGGGTWNYASASQGRSEGLAGIAPVVAPCMMSNGCNIAKASLPVMAIHVWDDRDAPASCTINAIRSINACRPEVTPNLIMYGSGGHFVWVKRAFDTAHNYQNPNMFEWFLAQNRKFAPNRKPIARAGSDQTITTSDASITLSATASSDADGKIVRYIWSKIAGPSKGALSGTFTNTLSVTDLTATGTYKYQLKVIDNRAEWSFDTVVVKVNKGEATPNTTPLAVAGDDVTINTSDEFVLDGSASSDPDGTITGYAWSQLEGIDSCTFGDQWNARTTVSGLTAGNYVFRLKVTDNRGATATDDITVNVKGKDSVDNPGQENPGPQVPPNNVVSSKEITVYPNPSRSNVTMILNGEQTGSGMAVIYDNMGRAVSKVSFVKSQRQFQQKLNTVYLERGLYYIDVMVGRNARYRSKFIRQ